MKQGLSVHRLLWIALCLALLAALALSSANAEDHTHDYVYKYMVDPTCTEVGYRVQQCSICGDVMLREIPAMGHDMMNSPWELNIPPTCAYEGRERRRCVSCGFSEYQTLPKTDEHQFAEIIPVRAATCTQPGSTALMECNNCGLQKGAEEIPPLGHSTDGAEWFVRREANCMTTGLLVRRCSRCNVIVEQIETERGTHPNGYLNNEDSCIVIPAVPPTCTEFGYAAVYQCPYCHETKGGELLSPAHSWGEWQTISAGSCSEEKQERRICAVCGETETRSSGLGHQWGTVEMLIAPGCETAGIQTVQCLLCGTIDRISVPALGHDFGDPTEEAATCTADGRLIRTCSRCSHIQVDQIIPALGHDTTGMSWEQTVQPTCVDNGVLVMRCARCGEEAQRLETAATGSHSWNVAEEGAPATCTQDGATDKRECSVCGAVQESEAIPALGHDTLGMGWQIVRPATCAQEGVLGLSCSRCGIIVEQQGISKTDYHTDQDGNYIDLNTFPPKEETIQPTCTETGKRAVYQCPTCGQDWGGKEIPALGHNWGEWEVLTAGSCTVEGQRRRVCSDCGFAETQNTGLAHDWQEDRVEPDCESAGTANRVCRICGAVENGVVLPPLGHSYPGEVITVYPTCAQEGRIYLVCDRCGKEYTLQTLPISDSHSWTTVISLQPTCTQEGTRVRRCIICGISQDPQTIPAMGHNTYGATWEVRRPATCAYEGQLIRRCWNCGQIADTQTVEKTQDHEWNQILPAAAATCTQEGKKAIFECWLCGAQRGGEAIPVLDHDMRLTAIQHPTCTQDGLNTYACSRCGIRQTETLPAAHAWGEWTSAASGSQRVCLLCGKIESEILPTPMPQGPCQHLYPIQQMVLVEPGCLTRGLTRYICTNCGGVVNEIITDPLGHLFTDNTATIPATCVTDGKVLSICDRCGDQVDTGHVLLATGIHIWEVFTEAMPATCTQPGTTALMHCVQCDAQQGGEAVPALGHTFTGELETVTPATCIAEGEARRRCERCDFYEVKALPATGEHDWQEEIGQIAPTCTQNGAAAVQVCSVCGLRTGGEVIPAAHQWGAWINLQTASCTVTGLRRHSCEICGETEEETVSFAHQWTEEVISAPTCTTDGVMKRTCALCNASENVVLPATGRHTLEWESMEATCGTDGFLKEACTVCGFVNSYILQPATGEHEWVVTQEVQPTCTTDGSRVMQCRVCGKQQTNPRPAFGHDFLGVEWTWRYQATCEAKGQMVRRCQSCGEIVDTMDIAPYGHSWYLDVPATPATCTQDGVTDLEFCLRCGIEQGGEAIPALGHDIVVTLIAPATATEDGSEEHACSRCDLRKTRILPATGSVLTLPARLSVVEEEAFADTAVRSVAVPSGVTAIRTKAFENCSRLVAITMPNSVTSIADDAFIGCDSLWFLCESDNAAAQYARSHGIDIIIE